MYTSTKYKGSKALNLTQTAKNGGVLLDAVPYENNFTISFAVTNSKDNDTPTHEAELVYMGSLDTSKGYYNIFRSQNDHSPGNGDPKHIRISQNSEYGTRASGSNAFNTGDWTIATFTVNNGTVTAYVNGAAVETAGGSTKTFDSLTGENFAIILGGLVDEYDGKDIFIDDLYIYDQALDATQVKKIYEMVSDATNTEGKKSCDQYHATTKIDEKDVDIAQIKKSLANNPYDTQREGWYYVNSHSTWADIEGCLASGKAYIGIYDKASSSDKMEGIEKIEDAGKDIATIPPAYEDTTNTEYQAIKESIEKGNTDTKETSNEDKKFNKAPENERSIRFYVDSQNHLRCFAWSGSTSKDGDVRTFCSLVYEKQDKQITKYEELNNALNSFYSGLARNSDLSNSAIVRFSTNSAVGKVDGKIGAEKDNIISNTEKNLQRLIMQNWTNYSDKYSDSDNTLERKNYLQNLLIPDEGETAVPVDSGSTEYPYVMTGGTYTWTGLKAFYDNMVDTEDKDSNNIVYKVANDAHDKYLILFTDGRDNTQDSETDGGKLYEGTTYCNDYSPEGFSVKKDGLLAEAWANKLKDEGYTIVL